MKSMLTAFAALTALALPAGMPTLALAQDDIVANATPSSEDNTRFEISEVTASAPSGAFEPQDRRGGRGGDRGGGGDRGDRGGDRGGSGGWNGGGDRGGDRGGNGGWNGGGRDRDRDRDRNPANYGNSPDRWNRPNPPVTTPTPPTQDRGGDRGGRGRDNNGQDWNRGNDGRGNDGRGRDNNGGWNGDRDRDRGSQGRGNDGRDRGGWNGGGNWNGGQNWDRDRDRNGGNWRSDRNGRRDYNGWSNRWNQNDWRRDWNRGRSSDWWRHDRGFRGYTGARFGFYFAPNYGYYSVPRNYWGRSWYAGDYLPSIFWRYSLNDYRTYGLGYPPPGTQWVAVDNAIYLIDQFDGYIIEVIRDAWRW